jgi:hypothetical protein
MSTSSQSTALGNEAGNILGGLFNQSNAQFPSIPTGGVASTAVNQIPADNNLQGYNPQQTTSQGQSLSNTGMGTISSAPSQLNQFAGQGADAYQSGLNTINAIEGNGQYTGLINQGQAANTAMTNAGNATYNTLAGQSTIPEQAGVAANTALTAAGQQAAAGGQSIYNSLMSQAGVPISAGNQQYAELNPYVSQALTQGFDPQQALYNQQFALQQQQSAAANAMSGVGQSAYGAGLTAQDNTNFNIDWQQSQLQRENTAANTAATLSGTAMNDLTSGYNTATSMENTAGNALQAGQATNISALSAGANALNQGYNTGSNMLLGGTNALNAGYTGGLNNIATANTTGLNNALGGMSALGEGISDQIGAYGAGVSGDTQLLGAGSNALATGQQVAQSGATTPSGLNQATVAQLLQYLGLGSTNAANQLGAENSSFNSATGLTSVGAQAQTAANQQTASGLGGLGSLLGTLGGAAIKAGAL